MTTTTFDLLLATSGAGPTHLATPDRPGKILCGDYRRRYGTFRQVGIVPASAATCEGCRARASEMAARYAVVIPPHGAAESIEWPRDEREQWALLTTLVAPGSRAPAAIDAQPDGATLWMDGEIGLTPGIAVNPRASAWSVTSQVFSDLLYGPAVITGPTDAAGTAGLTADRSAEVIAGLLSGME